MLATAATPTAVDLQVRGEDDVLQHDMKEHSPRLPRDALAQH